jgi:hypothetical protein
MGNYRRFFVLIALIITAYFSFNLYLGKQADEEAENVLLREYRFAINDFELASEYYIEDGVVEIELSPTAYTEETLERWYIIAQLLPEMVYPEEAIKQNEWLMVRHQLIDGLTDVEKRSEKIGIPSEENIRAYIVLGEESPDILEFIEDGEKDS